MSRRDKTALDTALRFEFAANGAFRVPVSQLTELKRDGQTVTFQLHLAGAPRPARKYVATRAWASVNPTSVDLCFGQHTLDGELRSVVQVTTSPDTIRKILDTSSEMQKAIVEFLDRRGVPLVSVEPATKEPAQVVQVKASAPLIATNRFESTIDFYNITPADTLHSTKSNYLEIDPVVRIELSSQILASLLDSLYGQAGAFPPSSEV